MAFKYVEPTGYFPKKIRDRFEDTKKTTDSGKKKTSTSTNKGKSKKK